MHGYSQVLMSQVQTVTKVMCQTVLQTLLVYLGPASVPTIGTASVVLEAGSVAFALAAVLATSFSA